MILDNKSDWDVNSNNIILKDDDEILGNIKVYKFRYHKSKQ